MPPVTSLGQPDATAIGFFCLFVIAALWIAWWAARRTKTTEDYFAAGRSVTAGQNGMALAGDFIAAAGFLGVAGLVSISGFDGLIYAVGGVLGWPVMMFLFAEPFRNLGRYTFADVLAYRLGEGPIRIMASLNSLVLVVIYLIMQMVGAGSLIRLLFGLSYEIAVSVMGLVMLACVLFGGMIATTWVQIIKAALMLAAALAMAVLTLTHFHFNALEVFRAAADKGGRGVLAPGGVVSNPIEAISVGLALVLGVASLPHVLMRFYTVADARTARTSLFYATSIIALFFLTTFILGFGAMALVGPQVIRLADRGGNMALPLLAQVVGGTPFLGFTAAVSFATILAVVAGLVIAGSASLSHDLWVSLVRKDRASQQEQLVVARIATVLLCAVAVVLGVAFKGQNIAFLVGLSTAVAASANFPVLVLGIFWPRLTTAGALAGMLTGLVASILLIYMSPLVQVDILKNSAPIFGLRNPAIVSMPAAFLACILVSLMTAGRETTERYREIERRLLLGKAT